MIRWGALTISSMCLMIGCVGAGDHLSDTGESNEASASGVDGGASATGPSCQSNDEFFRDRVWRDVLSPRCLSCHVVGGEAESTNFVLRDQDADPTQQEHNMNVFAPISRLEFDGEPWLLLKATADIEHAGGASIEVGSPEYEILEQMITRIVDPIDCP
jgi:hypothetical protein